MKGRGPTYDQKKLNNKVGKSQGEEHFTNITMNSLGEELVYCIMKQKENAVKKNIQETKKNSGNEWQK